AASMAMMATAQTTSRRLNPSSPPAPSPSPGRDICCCSCATFLPVRPVRDNVVDAMLTGRAIGIWLAPWISGNASALEIRTVPRAETAAALHQGRQPLRTQGISSGIEVEEVERAREALDLDLGGLHLRLAEVVEYAWAHQRDHEANDGDHDQD